MIVDCFQFFNELDILDLRLNILADVVDKFVLVESKQTFTGNSKKLYYEENKDMFSKFRDRIIHVIVDDYPKKTNNNEDAWTNEKYLRNSGIRGIQNISDDSIIMVSDLDEIPDPDLIKNFKYIDRDLTLCTRCCYYYLNVGVEEPVHRQHRTTNVFMKKDCKPFNWYRDNRHDLLIVNDAGWHFSYQGGALKIKEKIESAAHTEYNSPRYTDLRNIQFRMNHLLDPFDRPMPLRKLNIFEEKYPEYIRSNYSNLVKTGYILE